MSKYVCSCCLRKPGCVIGVSIGGPRWHQDQGQGFDAMIQITRQEETFIRSASTSLFTSHLDWIIFKKKCPIQWTLFTPHLAWTIFKKNPKFLLGTRFRLNWILIRLKPGLFKQNPPIFFFLNMFEWRRDSVWHLCWQRALSVGTGVTHCSLLVPRWWSGWSLNLSFLESLMSLLKSLRLAPPSFVFYSREHCQNFRS